MSGLPELAWSAAIGAEAVAGSPEKGVALKLGVEVMARIAPVLGSMATIAPVMPASCRAAKSWSRLSIVSVRSLGCGWRPRMSSKTSRSGFGSARPVSRSSKARSRPVVPNRRLAYPITWLNAGSRYVRREMPATTRLDARSAPLASKIVPRSALRRAAMTWGLSGREASCCASATCHHAIPPETTAKVSNRYPPSRRMFGLNRSCLHPPPNGG